MKKNDDLQITCAFIANAFCGTPRRKQILNVIEWCKV